MGPATYGWCSSAGATSRASFPGTYLSAHGVVGQRGGHLEMMNPEYTLLAAD